jgi:hypothetical protein
MAYSFAQPFQAFELLTVADRMVRYPWSAAICSSRWPK